MKLAKRLSWRNKGINSILLREYLYPVALRSEIGKSMNDFLPLNSFTWKLMFTCVYCKRFIIFPIKRLWDLFNVSIKILDTFICFSELQIMQHSTVLGLPHAMTGRPILYRPPQPQMVQVSLRSWWWFQELYSLEIRMWILWN